MMATVDYGTKTLEEKNLMRAEVYSIFLRKKSNKYIYPGFTKMITVL